jgi:hypothetical protein
MKERKRRKLYNRIVAQLPFLQYEDWVTPIKDLRSKDLRWLSSSPGKVFHDEPIIYDKAISQQCHTVAAYAWLSNPGWKLVLGFAAMDSMCGEEWHFHSFCIDNHGTIIEPTTLTRSRYWGVPLDSLTATEVAEEEAKNFARIGLTER